MAARGNYTMRDGHALLESTEDMANAQLGPVIQHIWKLASRPDIVHQSDEFLLDRYVTERDETAFEVLVRRHGPLVLGVCRHMLRHTQDAEDAYQATFLVLARRAASIRNTKALVSWLHGVAYRTAMKAKRDAARRRAHEMQARTWLQADPSLEMAWREVQAALMNHPPFSSTIGCIHRAWRCRADWLQ
jgi:hypothetical protein